MNTLLSDQSYSDNQALNFIATPKQEKPVQKEGGNVELFDNEELIVWKQSSPTEYTSSVRIGNYGRDLLGNIVEKTSNSESYPAMLLYNTNENLPVLDIGVVPSASGGQEGVISFKKKESNESVEYASLRLDSEGNIVEKSKGKTTELLVNDSSENVLITTEILENVENGQDLKKKSFQCTEDRITGKKSLKDCIETTYGKNGSYKRSELFPFHEDDNFRLFEIKKTIDIKPFGEGIYEIIGFRNRNANDIVYEVCKLIGPFRRLISECARYYTNSNEVIEVPLRTEQHFENGAHVNTYHARSTSSKIEKIEDTNRIVSTDINKKELFVVDAFNGYRTYYINVPLSALNYDEAKCYTVRISVVSGTVNFIIRGTEGTILDPTQLGLGEFTPENSKQINILFEQDNIIAEKYKIKIF